MLFLKRLAAIVLAAITLIVGFLFSVAILAVVITVALIVVGYLWWKTRAIRRAAKSGDSIHPEHGAYGGRTIEATEVYEVRAEVTEDQSKQDQTKQDQTRRPPQ